MKKKVFLTGRLHDVIQRDLKKRYKTVIHTGKMPVSRAELLRRVRGAEGLVCFPFDRIDREVMDAADLQVISTYSVGIDHIDTAYAKKKGIKIGYTPDVLDDATADLAFCLMLDVMRRVTEGDRMIRQGRWSGALGAYDYTGYGMQEKTLGIIGMGRIGSALAKRATAFGMKVIYHNRHRIKDSTMRYASFDRIISDSDVISLHVPHTKDTNGMIHAGVLEKMKPTVFLINTSRGAVINERDLIAALRRKRIAGAGLDVFCSEPVGKRHPLAGLQNVVLSPHIGSATAETRLKMAEIAARNLHLGMAGRKPRYSV
ncbi:MAG: D-glycerate dehydrogenase [Nitrosopumilus sp. B06]|nr:MAG: D-glycerate dehydrogenase [Nitrosopumilus sp. D6]RNJ80684.1 MAG: D-glycerate dehydrogenase [Nitrosopumilus sp. B06]